MTGGDQTVSTAEGLRCGEFNGEKPQGWPLRTTRRLRKERRPDCPALHDNSKGKRINHPRANCHHQFPKACDAIVPFRSLDDITWLSVHCTRDSLATWRNFPLLVTAKTAGGHSGLFRSIGSVAFPLISWHRSRQQ